MNANGVTWISSALPQRWAYKKDIPAHLRPLAIKVHFRFEYVWMVRDHENRVLFATGQWADTFDFYLRTPGHVIGMRDLATADCYSWSTEWRSAMRERIDERLQLGPSR